MTQTQHTAVNRLCEVSPLNELISAFHVRKVEIGYHLQDKTIYREEANGTKKMTAYRNGLIQICNLNFAKISNEQDRFKKN